MQPYFFPYAGYYRLIAASDLFVIYDCVQFPRRGWVHRNKLLNRAGEAQWLTLPLAKAAREVAIHDLSFAPSAAEEMAERLAAFPMPALEAGRHPRLKELLLDMDRPVIDYLSNTLEYVASHLGLPWNVVRSSSLGVAPEIRGPDRIREICRRVGATDYVNAPGGRDLYDAADFSAAGLTLSFLGDYAGSPLSMLSRIHVEDDEALAADIRSQMLSQ